MEKYNKAFKFRMSPNKEQEILIGKTFGCTRQIYNMFLDKRIKLYEEEKKSTTYNTQAKELPSLKKELEYLKEVDSISLQVALKNLEKAFKSFFQKKTGYPKFKSKRNTRKSYMTNNVNNSIRIEEGRLKFPKLKSLKIKLHRSIPNTHKIKSATISQEPNGTYYVSILTEFHQDIKPIPSKNSVVGLDYSSTELVEKYNAICIENLDLKSMKIKNLAKHTFDNAWGMFVLMLEYKAKFCGKQVVKVDKYFPSSKTCSSCNAVKSTLKLNERTYNCDCGLSIDRDLNASYNILSEGKKLLAY